MLCDSLGIMPVPNNGTLRLPLQPLGIHGEDDFDEPVYDPTPVGGAETTPTGKSKSIGVDPVSAVTDEETSAGGTKTSPPAPTETGETGEEQDNKEQDGEDKKEESKIKGVWNWITGTVGDLWEKVTGSR